MGPDTTRTMIGEVEEQVGGGEEKGFAEWSSRLLDLRGVAPVPRFAGTEGEWEEFRLKLCTAMALLGMSDLIEAAARERMPILIESMTSAVLARSRFLYSLLVQICSGRALAIIRLVTSQKGFEAWRQLEAEFAPVEPSRAVAMLAGLLENPTVGCRSPLHGATPSVGAASPGLRGADHGASR